MLYTSIRPIRPDFLSSLFSIKFLSHLKSTNMNGSIIVVKGIIIIVVQISRAYGYSSHSNVIISRTDDGTQDKRFVTATRIDFVNSPVLLEFEAGLTAAFDFAISFNIK